MLHVIKYTALVIAAICAFAAWFIGQDQMDPLMTKERKERILASPHYVNGEFVPETPHEAVKPDMGFWKTFLFPTPGETIPADKMITKKTDLKTLDPNQDLVVWMGHSSFYMQLGGKKILIDPISDTYASPVWFINKAFEGSNIYKAEDIPDDIDVMVLSHDHWDHLDYAMVKELEPKVKHVVTGLGNGGYYEKWGYPLEKIHEEEWNREVKLDGISVWILPTRHFSGRLFSRNQTLPAGFAFIAGDKKVFYSGDGGYDGRFAKIGDRFGSFDLALMENGQYNEAWHSVHMMPEESAKAAEELHAKTVLTGHNGKYPLAMHKWDEPYRRFEKASEDKSYTLFTPMIGEVVLIGEGNQKFDRWWEQMK